MQIADWLQKLGLGQYAQRFAENDIEIDLLNELTDQDFDRLGVSLGHRRRMIRAIRELGAKPVAAVAGAETPAPITSEPVIKETAARRQVTVIFCDLVGSTALSARMDPEDLREVISAYQKCVADTVQRFGGFVAKYMGDGALIYFGYPQAHEDDAERAVRAGLELAGAVVRTLLFSRIVPCVRDIGLWGPKVQHAYTDLGVIEAADSDLEVLMRADEELAEKIDEEKYAAEITARQAEVEAAMALADAPG